jgi:hypothetical protein
MRTVAFPRVNRAGPRARQGRLDPRSGRGGRRKVVREGAGQAAVTGEGAGWRVRRRRLPGPRSPPGPEPAVRTLPGRGSRASRGRARRAAAGKEVGAAPRDARASFMNAPCRVGCQGTGRPTGIPGTVKTWPRGARGGPWHARAAVVARHPGHELSPGTCPAGTPIKKPGEPGQGRARGAAAHPEHPTGAAAPRDAARTGTRRPRPHRRGHSDRGPPGGPSRHRSRRPGRPSALQVHRQARRMPLP